jgi:TAG lipase/lysophosphatidylethanolamine acyltransferase
MAGQAVVVRLLGALRRLLLWLVALLFERDVLKQKLRHAKTYSEYVAVGRQIDDRDNAHYKEDDSDSDLFDAGLLRQRAKKLEGLVARGLEDPKAVALALRTELRRNLGSIGNPRLYRRCVIGTKHVVGRYIRAVEGAVAFVTDTDFGAAFSIEQKEIALRNTRQAFGGSALLFSGGATLGMYHFGVLRLLHEQRLLPRVLSGSSIGSLVAAVVAVRTDEELGKLLTDIDSASVDFGQPFEVEGSSTRKLVRFLEHGVLMDICKLASVIRAHVGDLTFLEAYQRTGRIVNITVSSTRPGELPWLLNYLTAPDVLLWSASAASCALPLLYEAVALLAKDRDGKIVKYQPSGVRFTDGSGATLCFFLSSVLISLTQWGRICRCGDWQSCST